MYNFTQKHLQPSHRSELCQNKHVFRKHQSWPDNFFPRWVPFFTIFTPCLILPKILDFCWTTLFLQLSWRRMMQMGMARMMMKMVVRMKMMVRSLMKRLWTVMSVQCPWSLLALSRQPSSLFYKYTYKMQSTIFSHWKAVYKYNFAKKSTQIHWYT